MLLLYRNRPLNLKMSSRQDLIATIVQILLKIKMGRNSNKTIGNPIPPALFHTQLIYNYFGKKKKYIYIYNKKSKLKTAFEFIQVLLILMKTLAGGVDHVQGHY